MKFFKQMFTLSVLLSSVNCYALTQECTLTYRPKTDETAFAAVGSSLKIADKTCINSYLEIKADTVSGAITIPKGLYPVLENSDNRISFATIAKDTVTKVKSCAFCDPIDELFIDKAKPKTLCVLSMLKIESCAKDNSIAYELQAQKETSTGLCTPTLVYFGRNGDVLNFAINDCNTISKPTLTYDLSLGNGIRFLDEQIEIHKADNMGIYYSRLPQPKLKNNETINEQKFIVASN